MYYYDSISRSSRVEPTVVAVVKRHSGSSDTSSVVVVFLAAAVVGLQIPLLFNTGATVTMVGLGRLVFCAYFIQTDVKRSSQHSLHARAHRALLLLRLRRAAANGTL